MLISEGNSRRSQRDRLFEQEARGASMTEQVPPPSRPNPDPTTRGQAWKTRTEALEDALDTLMRLYLQRVPAQDTTQEWWMDMGRLRDRKVWA